MFPQHCAHPPAEGIAYSESKVHGPTWGPSGADRTQVGAMLAPWTLLSGYFCVAKRKNCFYIERALVALSGKCRAELPTKKLHIFSCTFNHSCCSLSSMWLFLPFFLLNAIIIVVSMSMCCCMLLCLYCHSWVVLAAFQPFLTLYPIHTVRKMLLMCQGAVLTTHHFVVTQQWPLSLTWINFNPSMDKLIISIIKCGMKLLIQSQTSTVQPLKFGNGWVILSYTLLGIYLSMLGLKFIHVSKRDHCCS